MLIGINYPWIDYGWDFGGPPALWVSGENLPAWRESKRSRIEEDFAQFQSRRIFAVRWFLLADGLNYGTGESAPRRIGNEWLFEPLPAGHPFYRQLGEDFEHVLGTCAKTGLKLLPSLIDFSWCRRGTEIPGSPGIIKGGRYGIVCDAAKQKLFFDRILDPLLDISRKYQDAVFAWELINEPEWVTGRFPLFREKRGNRTVTLKEMKSFITEGVRRIHAHLLPDGGRAFQSSVGFAHWRTLEKWDASALGISLHQFHYYAQGGCVLPPHPPGREIPCVVGEFASAAGRSWPDLLKPDMGQTVTHRLRCLEGKGYPACFLWSARAVDAATRWTADEHQELAAYTRSNGPGITA